MLKAILALIICEEVARITRDRLPLDVLLSLVYVFVVSRGFHLAHASRGVKRRVVGSC